MKTEIAEHMDKSENQQFPYRFKQEKINEKEQNLIVGLEKVLHLSQMYIQSLKRDGLVVVLRWNSNANLHIFPEL